MLVYKKGSLNNVKKKWLDALLLSDNEGVVSPHGFFISPVLSGPMTKVQESIFRYISNPYPPTASLFVELNFTR